MTDPATPAVDISAASAQTIVEQSQRLGLTWTMRLGTVEAASPLTVIYDGDTEPISMTSVIGQLGPGNRVYAIAVPPAGNFVIGYVTNTSAAFGTIYAESFTGNPLAATTSSSEAVISTSATAVQFQALRAYLVKARVRVDSNIAQVYGFRVRLDSLTGPLIWVEPGDTRAGGTSNFKWLYGEVPLVIGDVPSANLVVLTGAGGTGPNPMNWRGGTGSECYLLIQDIGPAALFQGIFATI